MGAIRQRMSAREFRAFQAGRPDHERWELIRGTAVMMTPPTIAHNRIAGNLERLLNAALAQHDPARLAVQWPGIELGGTAEDFRPEPDFAVIDADYTAANASSSALICWPKLGYSPHCIFVVSIVVSSTPATWRCLQRACGTAASRDPLYFIVLIVVAPALPRRSPPTLLLLAP